uniref:(Dimethylallyl)adenosine tRNA methylthiotransferase MiaB n=1 Tax=Lygus hesperus TaxID=30085 RepID=A0A0A9YPY4_LYGHE
MPNLRLIVVCGLVAVAGAGIENSNEPSDSFSEIETPEVDPSEMEDSIGSESEDILRLKSRLDMNHRARIEWKKTLKTAKRKESRKMKETETEEEPVERKIGSHRSSKADDMMESIEPEETNDQTSIERRRTHHRGKLKKDSIWVVKDDEVCEHLVKPVPFCVCVGVNRPKPATITSAIIPGWFCNKLLPPN